MSWNWINRIKELQDKNIPCVLVSVAQVGGSAPREVGAKMLVFANNDFEGTIGGGNLEMLAIQDAQVALKAGAAKQVRYPLAAKTGQCCGGYVDLLFDVMNSGPQLHVFGAGHVGQAVADVMAGTVFRTHLIDERAEWIQRRASDTTTQCHELPWPNYFDQRVIDESSYVVVMTHSHQADQEVIARLLAKPTKYIGLIGSKSKWQRFRQRLKAEGFTDAQLDLVHCPIGLPTGGKAPKEIAVSLAAELLMKHYHDTAQVNLPQDEAIYERATTTSPA